MKQGVIFDVGGVLSYDVWEHLLCDPPPQNPKTGDPVSISATYQVPADQLQEIGADLWEKYDKVTGNAQQMELDYWRQFLGHRRCPPKLKSIPISTFVTMTDDFIRPVSPVQTTNLLTWLSDDKQKSLGICSNNNEFWYQRQERKLELSRFFRGHITLSCRRGYTKKDPRIFDDAAAQLGLPTSDCVFVDDRMDNVLRSFDRGMTGVFFPSEQFASKPQRGAQYLYSLLDAIL